MARRSKQSNPERLRQALIELLENFEDELLRDSLRAKVQALVPARELLRDLGASLIPTEIASSGKARILEYLLKYPYTPIPGAELSIVAGIDDWARRVRELRRQEGWPLLSGQVAKQMQHQDELSPEIVDVSDMKIDDYILIETEPDREAAHRWHLANSLRKRPGGVRDKILQYLQANVGNKVTGEELRYVANDKTEWARRTRELRTEFGWPIVTRNNGRPDLPVGVYVLEDNRQSPEHDRHIPDAVRREVLRRDGYSCRRCSWKHDLYNRSDPRHLELHHVVHHASRGENVESNLVALCTVCHDMWHTGDSSRNEQEFYEWLDN